MRVGEVGDRPHLVSKPVVVRHPGHRDQAGAPIDQGLEVAGVDTPGAVLRDPQLDALRVSQVAVEDELGFVVQVVDHDVVARLQIERVGHDVLAFAGREQKADLVGTRVDQTGKLRAHLVGLPQHLAERDRAQGLALDKRAAGGHDLVGHRRDVGGVQIGPAPHDRKVAAHAKRIVRGRLRERHRRSGRLAARDAAETTNSRREIDMVVLWFCANS